MKFVFSVVCMFASCLCLGASSHEADGGLVKVSGKGHLAIVDCASGLDWQAMKPALQKFTETFHIAYKKYSVLEKFSVFDAHKFHASVGANSVLFVIDDLRYPMSVVAPEQKWACVNIAPLKAKNKNFESRCRFLFMRGIYRALGSDVSRAEKTCLSPVYSPEDLDKISDLGVAMDTFIAVSESCLASGLEPEQFLTYREACELPEPPLPTNDVQKAIYQEIVGSRKQTKSNRK